MDIFVSSPKDRQTHRHSFTWNHSHCYSYAWDPQMPESSVAIAILDSILPSVFGKFHIDVGIRIANIACRREDDEVKFVGGHPVLEQNHAHSL